MVPRWDKKNNKQECSISRTKIVNKIAFYGWFKVLKLLMLAYKNQVFCILFFPLHSLSSQNLSNFLTRYSFFLTYAVSRRTELKQDVASNYELCFLMVRKKTQLTNLNFPIFLPQQKRREITNRRKPSWSVNGLNTKYRETSKYKY